MEDIETAKTSESSKLFELIGTKCQKDALLYGISSGVTVGLLTFLFTSHPKNATRTAIFVYGVVTLCYGIYCLHNDYRQRRQIKLIQRAVQSIKKESI